MEMLFVSAFGLSLALWAGVSFLCAALLARNTLAHGLLGALETIVLLSLEWCCLDAGSLPRDSSAG